MSNNFTYVIAGGHITCNQCQAMSKRSRQRCKAPAMRFKKCCFYHGGKSSGHKTEAGRQRCASARTVHGRETTQARTERSLGTARLAVLEQVGWELGLFKGTRTRGPKPSKMDQVLPELHEAVRRLPKTPR